MEIGGVLKSFVVNTENGRVSVGMTFRAESVRVKNINGKTLGRTLNAQADTPSNEAEINFEGALIMQTRKKMTSTVNAILKKLIFVSNLRNFFNIFSFICLTSKLFFF